MAQTDPSYFSVLQKSTVEAVLWRCQTRSKRYVIVMCQLQKLSIKPLFTASGEKVNVSKH